MLKSDLSANAPPFVPGNFNFPGQQPVIVPQAHIPAPVAVVMIPPPVPVPGTVIAYANNFDGKHVAAVIDATSAVVAGRTRGPNVTYSTVFLRTYLEGVVLADAANKLAGNYTIIINCHTLPPGNFALAELVKYKWKAIPVPMFFCHVFYTLSVGGGGARTATLTHLQTG